MEFNRASKTIELNRLYDLYWESGSELDRALAKAKIRMISAELDKIEMSDTYDPLKG